MIKSSVKWNMLKCTYTQNVKEISYQSTHNIFVPVALFKHKKMVSWKLNCFHNCMV